MLTDFMRSYYETYNSGDLDKLRTFYADDVVLKASGLTRDGPDAIIGGVSGILSQFTDQMTPTRIIADDHDAAVEITDVFTAKVDVADWMGQPLATGESLTITLCGVYHVVDGKIKTIRIYGG
jgi:ketosteroid isomerase-like protein